MRNKEKIANRIILIAASLIIAVMLVMSESTRLLPFAFSRDEEYNLDYLKSEYDKKIYQKDRLIIGYGWVANKIGVKEINNLVKCNGISYFKDKDIVDIDKKAESMKKLNEVTGGKFAFVLLPSPIMSDYEKFQPYFLTDTYNGVHKLLNTMRSNGINVYDLSKFNNDKPITYRYLGSDHHWRPEFAFEFTEQVVNAFRDFYPETKVDPYYFDIANYNIETHKNLALGSYGKRVGPKFLKPDDFDIITPKYETKFIVDSFFFKDKKSREGNFDKMFISRNYLEKDYMNSITYKVYAGDILKEMHSKNLYPKIDKKILILLDSYSYPLSTFLCNIFEDVYTIDLRYDKNALCKKIQDIQPDMVFALYSQYAMDYSELFDVR